MNWQNYIHSNPEILIGKPVIKGTRISVELILELFEQSWTREMILESYPKLTEDDLVAVFAYLGECVQHELFFPITKTN